MVVIPLCLDELSPTSVSPSVSDIIEADIASENRSLSFKAQSTPKAAPQSPMNLSQELLANFNLFFKQQTSKTAHVGISSTPNQKNDRNGIENLTNLSNISLIVNESTSQTMIASKTDHGNGKNFFELSSKSICYFLISFRRQEDS